MPQLWNSLQDDVLSWERQESFAGGVNEYVRSTLLPEDALSRAQNWLVDTDHVARPRPGTTALGDDMVAESSIQGLAYYDAPNVERLAAVVDAGLQVWDGVSWTAVAGYAAASAALSVCMVQGVGLLYITDGSSGWWTFDGTTATALGTAYVDPPRKANIAVWHTSRMFAAGDTDNPDTLWASDILDAGNGHWQAAFQMRVGGGEGEAITALAPLQDFWLAVGKEQSIWLVNADPTQATAANWTAMKVSGAHGIVGPRAWCYLGNDVLALSREGVISLRRMAASADAYEVSPPISEPLQPIVDRINWAYAHTSCAARYRHFALFAVPLDDATTPDTVLVFNGRLGKWIGYWTGWSPVQFAVSRFGREQRLTFGDVNGYVAQWLDYEDASTANYYDLTNTDAATPVAQLLRSRGMLFGEPVSLKDPEYFEVRFEPSGGQATLSLITDGNTAKTWTGPVSTVTNQLPLSLPFNLHNPIPRTVRQSLVGVPPFQECYLQIEATAGQLHVRNLSVAAFVNTIDGDETQ